MQETKQQIVILEYLKNNLDKELIKFIYKTKDGNRRFASGTTHKAFLKQNFNIELKDTYFSRDGLVTYFDTDKKNWRSFRQENIKDITSIYKLDINGKYYE